MTPKEKELEKKIRELEEQNAGLKKRVAELEALKPKSQSRRQAEQALALLTAGPVSAKELKKINEKYPSDPIYYVRQLLHVDVKTVRKDGQTIYMTPEHFKVYTEGLEKEKQAQAAQAAEQKTSQEAAPQATA